jgi:phage repressor protein C with HTH and peptisase S24 domain
MFNGVSNGACNNAAFTCGTLAAMDEMHPSMRRLYSAAKALRDIGSQAELARSLNTTSQRVKNWESRGLSKRGATEAEGVLGVSPLWLLEGVGTAPARGLSTEPSTTAPVSIHKPESADETPEGYVRFSLLEGFVAAGEGGYVADYPEVVRDIDVAEDWVRRNLSAPPHRIRTITAQGDSMEPDIGSGDVLFVDSGITWFDSDAVYVMNWQGRPIVKRLQMRRDGRLLIKSTNPAYDPEEVGPGDVEQLQISGRVVGVWQFRKY